MSYQSLSPQRRQPVQLEAGQMDLQVGLEDLEMVEEAEMPVVLSMPVLLAMPREG